VLPERSPPDFPAIEYYLKERKEPMTYGPIDFVALEFKGNEFTGEIMPALNELIASKTIRIIDMVVVLKDQEGNVSAVEAQQHSPAMITIFDPLDADASEMIKLGDIEMIGEQYDGSGDAV
jgi:hypothetical protein